MSVSYTYDLVGNRLTKTDSGERVTSYIYNANDELLSETRNGEVTVYEYDANGNTISRSVGGKVTVYEWNDENRLVKVILPDGQAVSYIYNAEGIKVASQVEGVVTTYLVDSNQTYAQVLEEYVEEKREVSYVYGLDLISQERENQQTIYLVDGLGSTRILTNEKGEVIDSYDYDTFGNLINSSGNTNNNYRFAGEQFDENLEQYYLRQRYYDSEIARFTRRDTYEGRIREPITLHKYIYANANPVIFIDPSGEISRQQQVNYDRGNAIHAMVALDFVLGNPLTREYDLTINQILTRTGDNISGVTGNRIESH